MYRDMQAGAYDRTRDPPFLPLCAPSSQGEIKEEEGLDYEEEVSPMATPKLKPRPQYTSLASASQKEEYQAQVFDLMLRSTGFRGASWPMTLAELERELNKEDIRFAYYQVDYHIHLHAQSKRSMLSMCRDIDDVRQLRGWQTEVRQFDREIQGFDNGSRQKDDLFEVHEITSWRRTWRSRERRLSKARKVWANIMEERRRQRLYMLQERQNLDARFKFYGRQDGNRMFLREFYH